MINALKGTMMGRKVQSVEQVLEEAKGWAVDTDLAKLLQEADEYPDIFSFQELQTQVSSNRILLTNLETPAGKWPLIDITLAPRLGELSLRELFGISEGTSKFVNGKYEKCDRPRAPTMKLLPLRFMYFALRAAWMNSKGPVPNNHSSTVQEYFQQYLNTGCHYAESIRLTDWGDGKIKGSSKIRGWNPKHPLSVEHHTPEFKPNNDLVSLISGEPYLPLLTYWLFEDPSPSRVNEVLRYATGVKNPEIQIRLSTKPDGGYYAALFENDGQTLNLVGDPRKKLRARYLYAPKEQFKPRVKP